MPRNVLARDLMTRPGAALRHDMPIATAIATVSSSQKSALPVVDDHGRLVGMLSEKDCMHALLGMAYDEHPGDRVEHHMSTGVVCLSANANLLDAVDLFDRTTYRRIPVVDHEGRLIGVVCRHEVLRAFHSRMVAWQREVAHAPEAQRRVAERRAG